MEKKNSKNSLPKVEKNNMNKFISIFKSRTVWSVIILFAMNGFDSVKQFITPEWIQFINALLGLAIVYFRVYPKQEF